MYTATTASLPYLHSCYPCSLQRVDSYPTHEVMSYLLLLTCRLQWISTPYIWSFTYVSRSPVLINIPMFSVVDSNVYSDTHEKNTHIHSLKTQ